MIKNMLKIRKGKVFITIASLVCLISVFILANNVKGELKPYYSGDVIEFNNSIYVGTVNTGKFEIFTLENNKLFKKSTIISPSYKYNKFLDVKLRKESNKLYAYIVNGRYMYKYNISNASLPILEKTIKDNSWYWFGGVTELNGKIVTIGSSVKIWNSNMQVINNYNVVNWRNSRNISFSKQGKYIFNVTDGYLKVFSTEQRKYILNIKLEVKEDHIRKIYNDEENSMIYVVDDESIKKYDFNGNLKDKFIHITSTGYDVVKSIYSDYLYFTDGVGIVKIEEGKLLSNKWKFTSSMGIDGSWAMGLNIVSINNEEKIVLFNGSSIVVLNSNLEVIDYIRATEEEDASPKEPLYLKLDKNRAAPNSEISLRGGGFIPNDDLVITFVNEKWKIKADNNGAFNKIINVPSVLPTMTDIKVVGGLSDLSYSISFEIE